MKPKQENVDEEYDEVKSDTSLEQYEETQRARTNRPSGHKSHLEEVTNTFETHKGPIAAVIE